MKSEIENRPPYFSGFDPLPEKYKGALREDGKPFYLRSEKNKAIVISLHGFSANTFEARPVAEACSNVGIDAMAPLMPGHGYQDEESTYKMWSLVDSKEYLEGLRKDIKKARENYEKVFIYGQSMGGTLALTIAGEGLVDAVAATAPGIMKVSKIVILFMRIFGFLFGGKLKHMNPTKKFYNSAYEYIPFRAINSLIGLFPHSYNMATKVACPFLLVISENDDMLDPKKTLKALSNVKKEIEWYNESGHTMPLDVNGKEISESIAQFFKKHC